MVKKSDLVRSLVEQREYRKALNIAKDFKLGITPEQSSMMRRAYECMVHERFYLSIGTDIQKAVREGIEVLEGLYGRVIISAFSGEMISRLFCFFSSRISPFLSRTCV